MKKKNLYANVSHDYVEMIADLEPKTFRDKDGMAKVDLVLFSLGFCFNKKTNQAKYELLQRVLPSKDTTNTVLIRNPKKPYKLREMVVYSGKIRREYPYKYIYKVCSNEYHGSNGSNVMVGRFEHGGDIIDILDVGEKKAYDDGYKSQSAFETVSSQMRVMQVEKEREDY